MLLYLPSEAERRLIDTVDRYSTEGSALAYEAKLWRETPEVHANPVYTSTRRQIGVDLIALFDDEPRPDSAGDLTDRGWTTQIHPPFEFTRQHRRGPQPERHDALGTNRWIFACRS